jgi:hypothetical protein
MVINQSTKNAKQTQTHEQQVIPWLTSGVRAVAPNLLRRDGDSNLNLAKIDGRRWGGMGIPILI